VPDLVTPPTLHNTPPQTATKRRTAIVSAVTFLFAGSASAGVLLDNDDTLLRWDNVFGYETAFRVERRNPALLTDINADDADRNFTPGIVSNRFDIRSQLDYSHAGFGFDVSAAAWYDFVYHEKNHNDSPATFNPYSVPNNEFPRGVSALQGAYAELDNAFLFGNVEVAGLPASFRIGRYTLLWGESLFFPESGIAGGQAPVDENRIIGRPGSYARDVYMPVTQASGSIQLPDGFSLEAYYQFEWRGTRVPGAGSYLSTADYLDTGGERYLLPNGQYLLRAPDRRPPDSGQFGAALRWTNGDLDFGFYALRFNSRDPVVYFRPGTVTALNAIYAQAGSANPGGAFDGYPGDIIDSSVVDYMRGVAGTYRLIFPQGIGIYGASASLAFGNSNVAVEISGRTNMPLASAPLIQLPDVNNGALYPTGATLNGQLSSASTFGRNTLWDTANLQFELAASGPVQVSRNAQMLATPATQVAFRALFEPGYFEVLPNLNVTLNIGLGLTLAGYSRPSEYGDNSTRDVELGATATYRVFWNASLVFSHFLGSPYRQPLADRDFITFRIQRSL
jgi:hypothetical protein